MSGQLQLPLPSTSWYLYAVLCADKSVYAGVTTDLGRRVREHNGELFGGAKYTKHRRPVRLLNFWTFPDRSSASKAEAKFKKLKRAQKERLIASGRLPASFQV